MTAPLEVATGLPQLSVTLTVNVENEPFATEEVAGVIARLYASWARFSILTLPVSVTPPDVMVTSCVPTLVPQT